MNDDIVNVTPGDVYSAHMGGHGDAGAIAATVSVHRPTSRVVYRVVSPGVMRLGPHISVFRDRGYSITPYAEDRP